MKRHILLIITFLCIAVEVISNEMRVSSEEARMVAAEYYQQVHKIPETDSKAGEPELFTLHGIAEMWLVPVNDSWILVSTDKRFDAILALFTAPEKPDLKSYPPAAQFLISNYEYDIAYVRDSCPECPIHKKWEKSPHKIISQTQQTRTYPSSVAPLLGYLEWNQSGNKSNSYDCDKVYNKYCPSVSTGNCGHALVGCVAVAIGQIMRYWGWPYMADVPDVPGGYIYEKHFFEWELMPDYLINNSSLAEADMTASFLRDCGYDVGMSYGASASGATNDNAFNTFLNFGYDASTLTYKMKLIEPNWDDRLHTDLANGRPVYYTGNRPDGNGYVGHAFVVDGYDVEGNYHVNFGWGGYGNSYYNLSANTFTYGFSQKAFFGIQPDTHSYCNSIIISTPVVFYDDGIVRAGSITLNRVIITNSIKYRAYSATEVRLTNGTKVINGSDAVFAIRDVPCSSSYNAIGSTSPDGPIEIDSDNTCNAKKCAISVSQNPAKEIIYIHSDSELINIEIYSVDGHCVMKGVQSEWYVNHLPVGVYIIRAETSEGEIVQTKILHSK